MVNNSSNQATSQLVRAASRSHLDVVASTDDVALKKAAKAVALEAQLIAAKISNSSRTEAVPQDDDSVKDVPDHRRKVVARKVVINSSHRAAMTNNSREDHRRDDTVDQDRPKAINSRIKMAAAETQVAVNNSMEEVVVVAVAAAVVIDVVDSVRVRSMRTVNSRKATASPRRPESRDHQESRGHPESRDHSKQATTPLLQPNNKINNYTYT